MHTHCISDIKIIIPVGENVVAPRYAAIKGVGLGFAIAPGPYGCLIRAWIQYASHDQTGHHLKKKTSVFTVHTTMQTF